MSTEAVYLQHWHGWCHMKLLPSWSKFCVHYITMHHIHTYIHHIIRKTSVCDWMSERGFYTAHSERPLKWLQCRLIVTWLVPHETAAILEQVLCTLYNHAPYTYIHTPHNQKNISMRLNEWTWLLHSTFWTSTEVVTVPFDRYVAGAMWNCCRLSARSV